MLVTHTERPRELKWYHAGPMLYGDWGTSRFYVLGLAFYYSLHASFWYVLGVGMLVAAVGWAYTIVCRCYPDGGGVYSAARNTSRQLAVVGALLLFADYIVTAAISAYEGMHYLGVPDRGMLVPLAACGAIMLVGVVNYIGPRKAGTIALAIAIATLLLTLVIAAFALPHLPAGWRNIVSPSDIPGTTAERWDNLVKVILALSGVEAIANMTGIMVKPVQKTAKKSIWPVLIEVVVLNLIFAVAMNALPLVGTVPAAETEAKIAAVKEANADWKTNPAAQAEITAIQPDPAVTQRNEDIKNKVMRVMAAEYVHPWFAAVCGIVFGLLLLSAVNTAVMDMISIQYVMSRDAELPRFLQKLNKFGVPWIALLPAVIVPCLMVVGFPDLQLLGDLYAIGVVGAITINLGSCTANRNMPLKKYERVAMGLLATILLAVGLTLAWDKPHARWFAMAVVGTGLVLRYGAKAYPKWRASRAAAAQQEFILVRPGQPGPDVEVPVAIDASRPRVLVATRGGEPLLNFATQYAKRLQGVLMVLFVRQVNVLAMGQAAPLRIEDDPAAQAVFKRAGEICLKAGVPMVPVYVVSPDVAFAILDHAATHAVESVLMGVSREGTIIKALRGDVISAVAEHLPKEIPLLIHA